MNIDTPAEPRTKAKSIAVVITSTIWSALAIAGLITATLVVMFLSSGAPDGSEMLGWLWFAGLVYFAAFLVLQLPPIIVHARYRAVSPAPLPREALRVFLVYVAMAIITIACLMIEDVEGSRRAIDLLIIALSLIGAAIPASFLTVLIYNSHLRRSTTETQ